MIKRKIILGLLLITLLLSLTLGLNNSAPKNELNNFNISQNKKIEKTSNGPWWFWGLVAGTAGWMIYLYIQEKKSD